MTHTHTLVVQCKDTTAAGEEAEQTAAVVEGMKDEEGASAGSKMGKGMTVGHMPCGNDTGVGNLEGGNMAGCNIVDSNNMAKKRFCLNVDKSKLVDALVEIERTRDEVSMREREIARAHARATEGMRRRGLQKEDSSFSGCGTKEGGGLEEEIGRAHV